MVNTATNTSLRNGVNGDVGCKYPCRVASMVNITLEGEQTINGVAVIENNIVLVNGQTDATKNGVYVVSTGEWQRGVWFNNELNVASGTIVAVIEGTLKPNSLWQVTCDDDPIVFETSEINFIFFLQGGSSFQYLLAANNLNDVLDASDSRDNLGLTIGSDVQAWSAKLDTLAVLASIVNLTSLAGLSGSAGQVPIFTSPGVFGLTTNLGDANATTRGASLLPKLITISNYAPSPNVSIEFGAGNFIFSDFSGQGSVISMIKGIDAVWIAGTNQGGLDIGSVAADTTYHMFAINNPSTLASDFLFSLSSSSPTLPTGYTKQKKLCALRTDSGANIRPGTYSHFSSSSYKFIFKDGGTIDSAVLPGTASRTLYTLSVPPSSEAIFYTEVGTITNPGTNYFLYLTNPDQTDQTANPNIGWYQGANENMEFTSGPHSILTNSSRQVGGRLNIAINVFSIYTKGWIEYL